MSVLGPDYQTLGISSLTGTTAYPGSLLVNGWFDPGAM